MTATMHYSLRLALDSAVALDDLHLLSEAACRLPKLRQALLDLGDFSAEISLVQRDVPVTQGTAEGRLVLQLPQRVRDLAAATRAGKFDGV